MYELTVTGRFSAAHQLRNYKGKCENLHGHNWKVQVTVTAGDLNEIGLGMDFKDIKQALHDILNELDHLHLNDLPMFRIENPSSEVIARWIFERISERLENERIRVARVTTWESDDACAAYIRES